MNKKIFSAIMLTFFFVMTFFVVAPNSMVNHCKALDLTDLGTDDISTNSGLSDTDPREVMAKIIKFTMSFLAIISVLIILYGGFKWMTATGNEDQVAEAKKIITQGIIGLIIILSAWGIANLVLTNVLDAVG